MKHKFDFSESLEDFFDSYLEKERHATPMTQVSYADTMHLFVDYMEKRTGRKSIAFKADDFTRKAITDFLDYLEQQRGNCVRTRNIRLACLRSYFSHLYDHREIVSRNEKW